MFYFHHKILSGTNFEYRKTTTTTSTTTTTTTTSTINWHFFHHHQSAILLFSFLFWFFGFSGRWTGDSRCSMLGVEGNILWFSLSFFAMVYTSPRLCLVVLAVHMVPRQKKKIIIRWHTLWQKMSKVICWECLLPHLATPLCILCKQTSLEFVCNRGQSSSMMDGKMYSKRWYDHAGRPVTMKSVMWTRPGFKILPAGCSHVIIFT